MFDQDLDKIFDAILRGVENGVIADPKAAAEELIKALNYIRSQSSLSAQKKESSSKQPEKQPETA